MHVYMCKCMCVCVCTYMYTHVRTCESQLWGVRSLHHVCPRGHTKVIKLDIKCLTH